MTASLHDVAKMAGVSIATASRVLSDSDYPVREATRDRVRAAASNLDYTPNALARSLISTKSSTVGIIVGSVVDPFFAEITAGLEECGSKSGILTMVCNGQRDLATEASYVALLRQHRVDGIVFAGGMKDDAVGIIDLRHEIDLALAQGMTIVAVGPRLFDQVPAVRVDDREMVFDLTQSLIDMGHRKLLYLAGPPGYSTARLRTQGFVQAMEDNGLGPVRVETVGFDYEDGLNFVHEELSTRDPRLLPDAIVTANDNSALGVLFGLREMGVRVPEDVSVAGIDDVRDARLVGLSSVRIPLRRLGHLAAERILKPSTDAETAILPHVLIHRQTTRTLDASRAAGE